jgi:hypothetical protein
LQPPIIAEQETAINAIAHAGEIRGIWPISPLAKSPSPRHCWDASGTDLTADSIFY